MINIKILITTINNVNLTKKNDQILRIAMINIKLLIRLFANGVKRRPAPEDRDQRAAESEVGRQRVL